MRAWSPCICASPITAAEPSKHITTHRTHVWLKAGKETSSHPQLANNAVCPLSAALLCSRQVLSLQRLGELQGAEKGALHQQWKAFDRATLKPLLGGRLPPGEAGGQLLSGDTEYQALSEGQEELGPTEVTHSDPIAGTISFVSCPWGAGGRSWQGTQPACRKR